MDTEFVEVRISAPDAETGQAIAALLVGERLAACAQLLGPMTSTYWWEGKVETEQEHLVLLKTETARFEAICERVRAEHPYDTPEILAVPIVGASGPYAVWLRESLQA
jgi:periplasmic divalent cation tolerance protein